MKLYWLRFAALCVLILFVHILFLSSCIMQFRTPDKEVLKRYKEENDSILFQNYTFANRTIHYAATGDEQSDTVLLFIHGSPGAWDAFEIYLKDKSLRKRFRMISVDRPGFGYSDFGKKEESLNMQSWVYAPILRDLVNKNKKIILIGHSYGGPVIAKMAMDYGDAIAGLIFIAPSLDPELEPRYWVQIPATWTLIRWMLPRTLVVSNEEILALKPQLENIKPEYKNVHIPVIFIQGGKDELVHPDNRLYAEKMYSNATFVQMYYPELNHFIPFMQPEIVREGIDKMSVMLRR
jgi:pimeloyl-ACP methyl ester carboxylesterase